MDAPDTVSRELQEIDAVISKNRGRHGELLSILEESQVLNDRQYLSEEVLNHIAMRTGVPLSRIYNVVTFYSFFNLRPQGKHKITVCRGTACHTKGSKALLNDLGLILNCTKGLEDAEADYTTPDGQYTISTVACFGQCAMAPVVAIDGVIHSNVTAATLQKLLSKITKRRARS